MEYPLGDADTDDVIFQGEVASNIVPDPRWRV